MSAPGLLSCAVEAADQAFDALEQGAQTAALIEAALALSTVGEPPAFARLCEGLALAPEDAGLVLLLLAHAADEGIARRAAAASPRSGGQGLPVWLVSRLVPGSGAARFAASCPLRRMAAASLEASATRSEAHVRLAEPVLDRLLGMVPRDNELSARIRPASPSACRTADPTMRAEIAAAFSRRDASGLSHLALFPEGEVPAIAAALDDMGLAPFVLASGAIPADPVTAERLAIDWSREAMLDSAALIVAVDEVDAPRAADFAARVLGHVVLTGPVRASALTRGVRIAAGRPATPAELAGRWAEALGTARVRKLGPQLSRIAAQFRLEPAEIAAVVADALDAIDAAPSHEAAAAALWHRAGRIAQPVAVPGVRLTEPVFAWDDIVLPPAVERALRRLEGHVRHATTVMDDWGFARRIGGRGRGVVALLSGPSGTGKTMAAEVLASSLELRMMVIDLSQVISKWVGETSKNIAACFAAAERSGAVMVWNEGDAIWGARGSVGSATDRHVNAEVGDLLQRMESFDGFSVVTTNLRHAVDTAFLRRFRFMIDFPMPGDAERLRIWQKAFPAEAPVEALDFAMLAALPLSGGSIRNVALGSAFRAASLGGRIDAAAIASELAEELAKQDLPMPVLDWGARP